MDANKLKMLAEKLKNLASEVEMMSEGSMSEESSEIEMPEGDPGDKKKMFIEMMKKKGM